MKQLGFNFFVREEANGFSSGIWILWKDPMFSVHILYQTPQIIHIKVIANSFSYFYSVMHGSTNAIVHKQLWSQIRGISNSISGKWVLSADFNSFLSPDQKSRPVVASRSQFMDFSDCITKCGLLNLHHKRPIFTWQHGSTKERLDWVLGNVDWLMAFPDSFVDHLPRLKSNHNPILLCLGVPSNRSRPTIPSKF